MQKQSHLEEAIALLIQTQATFVSQLADTNRDLAESKREIERSTREIRKDFGQIQQDFVHIKAMLLRHEKILSDLPEAIRQKIGFQPS